MKSKQDYNVLHQLEQDCTLHTFLQAQTFSLQTSCRGIRRVRYEFQGFIAAAKPAMLSLANRLTSLSLSCFVCKMVG